MLGTNHIALNVIIACPITQLRNHIEQIITQRLPNARFTEIHSGLPLQAAIINASVPYDVIILDSTLPALNYAALWQCLQAQSLPYAQPLVLLGAASPAQIEIPACLAAAMVSYLQKPLDMTMLANQMYGYAYFIERAKQYEHQLQQSAQNTTNNDKAEPTMYQAYAKLLAETQRLAQQTHLAKTHFLENLTQEFHPSLQTRRQLSQLLKTDLGNKSTANSQQNLDKICAASAELLAFVEELQAVQSGTESLSASQIEWLVAFQKLYLHDTGSKILH